MKNVLLFAGSISPYKGSEHSVAWNYVTQMSKHANLFVLYLYDDSKEDVERYLSTHELTNVHFFYCGAMPNNWIKKNVFFNMYTFYAESKKLHNRVLVTAKEIIEKNKIDVIHFLNPIGFKEPGYLWQLNKPYVWGPVQAVANWPLSCCSLLSKKGWIEFALRSIVHNFHFYFNSRVKRAFKKSNVIVAATKDSQKMINRVFKVDTLYRPENALIRIEAKQPISYIPQDGPLNIIAAGSLDDRKCLKMFLKAMLLLKKHNKLNNVVLHVCGAGYLGPKLKKYCKENALDGAVIWHGRLTREETQKIFEKAHLHIITSLGEATTTVLWEAMAKGVPTLSLNHCGMGSVLTEESSFLIPVRSLHKILNDIEQSVCQIKSNPQIIEEKSKRTLELAKHFLWNEQIQFFTKCYDLAETRFYEKEKTSAKEII